MIKERDYLWDNIKAFLITTVVVGHVLPALNLTALVSQGVTYIIFSFHMPAFVFVSGLDFVVEEPLVLFCFNTFCACLMPF